MNSKKSGLFKINKIRKGKEGEFKIKIDKNEIRLPIVNTYKYMVIMLMNNNRINNHITKIEEHITKNL